MEKAGIDVVRIVWSDEYEPLHVEPSADCPGYVRVLAKTEDSEKFWGKVDFTLPKDMALMLAKAIQACAEEQS
jgi:hypothetical protein